MIIPPPGPVYTLAPDLENIGEAERAVLDRCLAVLAGRAQGLLVTGIQTTPDHFVVDVETEAGPVLILERRARIAPPDISLPEARAN